MDKLYLVNENNKRFKATTYGSLIALNLSITCLFNFRSITIVKSKYYLILSNLFEYLMIEK